MTFKPTFVTIHQCILSTDSFEFDRWITLSHNEYSMSMVNHVSLQQPGHYSSVGSKVHVRSFTVPLHYEVRVINFYKHNPHVMERASFSHYTWCLTIRPFCLQTFTSFRSITALTIIKFLPACLPA